MTVTVASGCSGPSKPTPYHRTYPKVTYPADVFHAHPLATARRAGITKIKHVVIVTQENRSFDEYFGTYPGADGLSHAGHPCLPWPGHPCVRPYHTNEDVQGGGPHTYGPAVKDINHGRMNGFVEEATRSRKKCVDVVVPACAFTSPPTVMGYMDRREIPNYWKYAEHYTLMDHFFNAVNSWSFPAHLYEVSG